MDVDSIATRMKSNKRSRNKTYNQKRKKSSKTQTHNLNILSYAESPSYMNINSNILSKTSYKKCIRASL
jgi:hypothetical protein